MKCPKCGNRDCDAAYDGMIVCPRCGLAFEEFKLDSKGFPILPMPPAPFECAAVADLPGRVS